MNEAPSPTPALLLVSPPLSRERLPLESLLTSDQHGQQLLHDLLFLVSFADGDYLRKISYF